MVVQHMRPESPEIFHLAITIHQNFKMVAKIAI